MKKIFCLTFVLLALPLVSLSLMDYFVPENALAGDANVVADQKYKTWDEAYDNNDLSTVLKDKNNLTFTETELNYIINKNYNSMKKPPIKNVKLDLVKDGINLNGYLMDGAKGTIQASLKPVIVDKKIALKVVKVKFFGFLRLPTVLANKILTNNTKDLTTFFYSNKDKQDLSIAITNDKLELSYK